MKRNMMEWVDNVLAAKQKQGFFSAFLPGDSENGDHGKGSDRFQRPAGAGDEDCGGRHAGGGSFRQHDGSFPGGGGLRSTVHFSDDEVPTVTGSIVHSEEEADALKVPEIGAGRTQIYIDAIGKAVELVQDRPVFAGVIGPFSLAGRLMDVTEAMIYCYDEPDMVHTVLEKATEFLIKYITHTKQWGANGVLVAEAAGRPSFPVPGGGVLCDLYEERSWKRPDR